MDGEKYHLRRIERDMPDRADQLAVLRGHLLQERLVATSDLANVAVIRLAVKSLGGKQGH